MMVLIGFPSYIWHAWLYLFVYFFPANKMLCCNVYAFFDLLFVLVIPAQSRIRSRTTFKRDHTVLL